MAKNIVAVSRPSVFLLRIAIFLTLTGFIGAILFDQIKTAFMANPGLNGLIVAVLIFGILYCLRQIFRLYPEIKWLNNFRFADPTSKAQKQPKLLASMANLLGDRLGQLSVSTNLMSSILDSVASRLDEARDISRYMVGLLVFLGLLGTFWGLLGTINSVSGVIGALDSSKADSVSIFQELKSGLEAPLGAMGTAFSSSLFGLAGSLILGFLDLQASGAQNRFYHETEEWLAASVETNEPKIASAADIPAALTGSLTELNSAVHNFSHKIDAFTQSGINGTAQGATGEMNNLTAHLGQLVEQMRAEQTIVRQWVDEQASQQADLKQMITSLTNKLNQ